MNINLDKCKYMCNGERNNDNDMLSLNQFNLKNSYEVGILWLKTDQT